MTLLVQQPPDVSSTLDLPQSVMLARPASRRLQSAKLHYDIGTMAVSDAPLSGARSALVQLVLLLQGDTGDRDIQLVSDGALHTIDEVAVAFALHRGHRANVV